MSLMNPIFQFFGGNLGAALLDSRPLDGGRPRTARRSWVGRIRSQAQAPVARVGGGFSKREIRRAIAELNQYSDRELADLSLSRSEIPFAVRFGRPDHPHDLHRAA